MRMWRIEPLCDRPELLEEAARWFHEKWDVPLEAYRESMRACVARRDCVPQWYLALVGDQIVGGLGVIENDFHKRPDLAPNICAVYVERACRRQGMARALMERACADLRRMGRRDVYLITTHTAFYERCGWEFYGMIEENDGNLIRMYHRTC